MYDNIGSKIKGLAKVTFYVEAVAAIIGGIALMVEDEDLAAMGLLLMIVGPLVAWVSTWLIYGFGELIDKACDIAQNTSVSTTKPTTYSNTDFEKISKF